MQFLKKTAPFGVILAVLFLAACQTTSTTPVAADKFPSLISGVWDGHFINRQGTRYPVTFRLQGSNGKVSGKAHIPDSSYDEKPSLTGTYSGNEAVIETSSGFKHVLEMSVADNGDYWLKGRSSGPNTGRLELKRQ
ncbi:hypothetical protein [Sneathiella aquimaris]|nr:hypothetical protein [Sneathiella aquimaris]